MLLRQAIYTASAIVNRQFDHMAKCTDEMQKRKRAYMPYCVYIYAMRYSFKQSGSFSLPTLGYAVVREDAHAVAQASRIVSVYDLPPKTGAANSGQNPYKRCDGKISSRRAFYPTTSAQAA